ncbi:FecR family protein [Chitinophaga polysaccharea]|uniref:FecR family protein n=1 Tax=Chitinophaga polysaccharea TaxID=1293035 RepID=A0A561PW84_9BACT|nr:FecR domain-containing protein [Chitinophaga polysaccharea]TWF42383.1 FecR family protein [Chitinophaga polysaccharea]
MNSAEEIYRLMTEKIAGLISATDDQWLEDLIESDPEVREKWIQLSAIQVPPPPDPWIEIIDFKPRRSIYRRILPWAAAAAVLALVSLTAWKWNFLFPPKPAPIAKINTDVLLQVAGQPTINLSQSSGAVTIGGHSIPNKNNTLFLNAVDQLPEGMNTLIVPPGKSYEVALPDGSVVNLNASTRMDFSFATTVPGREITLNGEAYLKIARQPNRPFLVHLPNSTVEVLGTSFNINSYDSSMVKVSLVDGKVRMKAGKKTVTMKPGQQAIFNKQAATLDTQPFNATVELSWQKGLYCFSNTHLDEICQSVFRWYGVKAVLDKPELASRTFTGLLDKSTSMSFFLEGIKATTGTDYYFTADSTLHFK